MLRRPLGIERSHGTAPGGRTGDVARITASGPAGLAELGDAAIGVGRPVPYVIHAARGRDLHDADAAIADAVPDRAYAAPVVGRRIELPLSAFLAGNHLQIGIAQPALNIAAGRIHAPDLEVLGFFLFLGVALQVDSIHSGGSGH